MPMTNRRCSKPLVAGLLPVLASWTPGWLSWQNGVGYRSALPTAAISRHTSTTPISLPTWKKGRKEHEHHHDSRRHLARRRGRVPVPGHAEYRRGVGTGQRVQLLRPRVGDGG